LLPEGEIAIATYRDGSTKTLVTSDATECDLPMVVLVNGNTASAAELFTASLRDFGKATVVGTNTFGKGIMQVTKAMADGGALTLTVATYQTTKGECYHKVGIAPDETVEAGETGVDYDNPDPETDPQLCRAIALVTE
jgi:carboxyl-terminal processing protease